MDQRWLFPSYPPKIFILNLEIENGKKIQSLFDSIVFYLVQIVISLIFILLPSGSK